MGGAAGFKVDRLGNEVKCKRRRYNLKVKVKVERSKYIYLALVEHIQTF